MKKMIAIMAFFPVLISAVYRVESTLQVDKKTVERVHLVNESDHIVYPYDGMILDVLITTASENIKEYNAHVKIVHRSGAVVAELDEKAAWGNEVRFVCPSEKATGELTMKVTQQEAIQVVKPRSSALLEETA